MPYLLDGNNLIGLARKTARPSEEDRAALVAEIAQRLRQSRARVVLFFDGPGGRSTSLGNLSIRDSGGSADDAIAREIGRARAPQEITVVTADRGLARRARDLGARELSPPEFWQRVGTAPSGGERQDDQPVNVEEWERYFEDPENRNR